jgi:hypothetical protein
MPYNDFQYTAMNSLKTRASTGGWKLAILGHNMDGDVLKVEIESTNPTTGKHRTQRFDVDVKGNTKPTYEFEKDLD